MFHIQSFKGEIDDNEKMGIIPRIIHDIFNHIYNMVRLNFLCLSFL